MKIVVEEECREYEKEREMQSFCSKFHRQGTNVLGLKSRAVVRALSDVFYAQWMRHVCRAAGATARRKALGGGQEGRSVGG